MMAITEGLARFDFDLLYMCNGDGVIDCSVSLSLVKNSNYGMHSIIVAMVPSVFEIQLEKEQHRG